MRIRFKPWARPELEASPFYIDTPEEWKGEWSKHFAKEQPLHIELGCGKGGFISQMAVKHPEVNYLAVDLVDAMLGLAKRKIEEVYQEEGRPIDNVILTRFDVERIFMILGKQDAVERIYIHFCNPWPRGKHKKKRLTHERQLEKYKEFLKENGCVYFKTDDDGLFEDSLHYFERAGFEIVKMTRDLHTEKAFWENIQTEHEKMFLEQGIKIKALIARYTQKKEEQTC